MTDWADTMLETERQRDKEGVRYEDTNASSTRWDERSYKEKTDAVR